LPWAAFFFGQVTVSGEQVPPTPHPGMADTHGCPKILPKQTHTCPPLPTKKVVKYSFQSYFNMECGGQSYPLVCFI